MGKLKTLLIQVFIGVVLLEILLRCLYFQKLGNDPVAIVSGFKSIKFRATDNYRESLVKNHNIIRPDSAKVNGDIVDEVIASNSFEYTPWVDFKLIDFSGKYINTKGFVRRSVPDGYFNGSEDTLKVFCFGGSTMFGFDVTDRETIPSALAGMMVEKCDSCRSARVYNYGVLSYYSYNEMMLLHHLLATNNRPDIVVFLDGLNDLFMVQAARKRVPWYYFRLKENVQNRFDSTGSFFHLLPGQTVAAAADDAVINYLENVSHIGKLCAAYNVKPLFFIQPVPYYNYPGLQKDAVVDKVPNEVISYGYSVLKQRCDTSQHIYFLGDMLTKVGQPPFIDEIHYSPYMNRRIAGEIFNRISVILRRRNADEGSAQNQ